MKIVVCVKQIYYTYARTGLEPEEHYLAPEDRICKINDCDEEAMALAAGLKVLHGDLEIIMVTMGSMIAENELRRCAASGADTIVQIDHTDTMDTWTKSGILAHFIRPMAPDLVLCGKESQDTRNGQMGAFLAHRLGWAFVSGITSLNINGGNDSMTVQRNAGRGTREIIECALPAVFSVNHAWIQPHLPTFDDKKRAQSLPIKKLYISEDVEPGKVISEGVFPPRPRPKQVPEIDAGLEAYDRIDLMLKGTRMEKKGVMLEGNPESQVEGIISFLKERGFL